MKTAVLAFGSLSEPYWKAAQAEYVRRLAPMWPLTVTELPEARLPASPSDAEIRAALAKEAEIMRGRIPARSYVIALCVKDDGITSEALSARMERAAAAHPTVAFLIGSSYGMDPALEKEADFRLSLSALTLPHQLARVVLCEQIYRAAMIAAGRTYHK